MAEFNFLSTDVYTPPAANAVNFEFNLPAFSGREMFVKDDLNQILMGLRQSTANISASAVDVTDVNSGGYRELLDTAGEWSLDVAVSGILKDEKLMDKLRADKDINLTGFKLVFSDGEEVAGDYKLTQYSNVAPYNDAVTFDAALMLSGQKI